jgi:chromosome partitioning protein
MTNLVYVAGGKGGTGKTTTANLLCLGAILRNEPAAYVLTDPERKVRGGGRPYGVLDGRMPNDLAHILNASRSTLNGWLVLDGGGNRPAFDVALAAEVTLCLLPFKASEEDLDTVAMDLQRLPNAIAWPTAWPTNAFAEKAAQFYIDALAKAFPHRVIATPIPFVNSMSELLATELASPSTAVRRVARRAFALMEERFEEIETNGCAALVAESD